MTILKDIVGSYEDKDGNKKYKTVGWLCENEKGQYIALTCFGKIVNLSLYDHKEKGFSGSSGPSQAYQYKTARDGAPAPQSVKEYGAPLDDEVPF